MSGAAEALLRAAVLDRLRVDAALGALVNHVGEGEMDGAAAPHIAIGPSQSEPWGGRGVTGAEVRIGIDILLSGRESAALSDMLAALDGAMDSVAVTGWRIVTMLRSKTRIGRAASARWRATIDYRARMVPAG